jgi:hypothetical protein
MNRPLLDALKKPFLAMLVGLAFGAPCVYLGFQTLQIAGQKGPTGAVTIDFAREHFGGLVRLTGQARNVRGATLRTSRSSGSPGKGPSKLILEVFVETDDEAVSLMAGASSLPDSAKRELAASINAFLGDAGRPRFAKSIDLDSAIGWIGLPLLAVGVIGLLSLPAVFLRAVFKART